LVCQNVSWCFLSRYSTILVSSSSHVLAPFTDIREVPGTYLDRHTNYAGRLFVCIPQSPHKNSWVHFNLRHIHFLLLLFNPYPANVEKRVSLYYSNIYLTRCNVKQFIYIWKLLYMFRVVLPPIIRSAYNCIYSIWYLSHRYCYLPLSWKSWNRFQLFHDSGR
jgi:hypothetical protein